MSDIFPMFIEPTITWVSLRGSLGTYYVLTQKLCFKKGFRKEAYFICDQ